jgi:hypothetical protein
MRAAEEDAMNIPAFVIMAAQHATGVTPTGTLDDATLAALRGYDVEHGPFRRTSTAEHLVVSVAQHASGLEGAQVDGVYGPQTQRAVEAYLARTGVGTTPTKPAASPATTTPTTTPATQGQATPAAVFQKDGIDLLDSTLITPQGGLADIPTRKRMKQVYGNAETLGEDGMRKRLVNLRDLPGKFNKGDGRLYDVHPLMAPHLRLALELCQKFGVLAEIHRIGCFNYRHMRHDPSLPLSYHAYGICVDVNPSENFGWTPSTAKERAIQPFTQGWRAKYPKGLSEVAVRCFQKAGFTWGGDWPTFRDPMHFELVKG